MSRVIVINHITLDGVMQAPGRADEDTRDGFEHGGWSPPYGDDVMGAAMGARISTMPRSTSHQGHFTSRCRTATRPW